MQSKIFKGVLVLKRVGTSMGMIIPKHVRSILNIHNGDLIGVKFWKIVSKEVKCNTCNGTFLSYILSKNHDCPFCGDEFKLLKGGTKKMTEDNEQDKNEEHETEETTEDEEDTEDKKEETTEDKE